MKKSLFARRSFIVAGLLLLLFISQFSFAQNPLVKQWDYRFGGTSSEPLVVSLLQTSDGGYILGGSSVSGIGGDKTQASWGDWDYWIVKLDSLGNKQWDKDFGGTNKDVLFSMQQTADGGYILGGFSNSGISGDKTQANWDLSGYYADYWIVKTDSLGNLEWDKDFGGTSDDELFAVQQTADRGYILGGWSYSGINGDKTQSTWGAYDYWIVKTDSLGNKQWDKDFGGTHWDNLISLQQTLDRGYILGGYSYSGIGGDKTQADWDTTYNNTADYWIVKIDSLGNKQWDKDFGGTNEDRLSSIQQTSDGEYLLGGNSSSGINGDKTQDTWGSYDYWIVKTDSLGNKQWDKDFGGTEFERLGNVSHTSNEGYLIAGTSYSPMSGDKTENNLGQGQTWIIKTDLLGNKQWDKTIFTNGNDETGLAIQTKDGCYAIANVTDGGIGGDKTQASWGDYDYWIIKFCDSTSAFPFIANDNKLCEKFCTNFYDQSTNNPTTWQWNFPGGDPSSSTLQNPTNICYNSAGIYDVTLVTTNANGSDTLTLHNYITVNPTPPIPTITQVGYTLISSLSSTYQWQLNSVDISGSTNQSYTVLQSGLYTVIVGDANGCSNAANQYVLISGVEELNSDANILISPNPSSGNFTVELLNQVSGEEILIEVMNTLGQKVFSSSEKISITDWMKKIDLSDVADGIYFIEIKTKNDFVRRKILITQ